MGNKSSKERLSKERYMELLYFCRQYNDKAKVKAKNTEVGKKARYDVELIEKTAAAVRPDIASYIVESVATGKPWEVLHPPCGRKQFYAARTAFFNLLSSEKGN